MSQPRRPLGRGPGAGGPAVVPATAAGGRLLPIERAGEAGVEEHQEQRPEMPTGVRRSLGRGGAGA
ncbi:hypothetical protein ABT224_41505 [Streptomyces sp. NPDC001584]|uniref:hypothetical protein n=1 Tax=Streptomyces sp. NPDC001584 TaxID=3154521 RepID=UPI0033256FCA